MYIPFDHLPGEARLWVYQANRPFTAAEIDLITKTLTEATQHWDAHGAPLEASFSIRFNQVVLVAVNESVNDASGCSIDASTRWFKSMGEQLSIDFFDRSLALVREDSLTLFPIAAQKNAIHTGQILPTDIILAPLLQSVGQLPSWLVPAADSYVKRFFQVV